MAQISKLVASNSPYESVDMTNNAQGVATSISDRIAHNDDIMQLFPDIELPIQILVSSIISPNDMITVSVNYNAPQNLKIPQDLKNTATELIKSYIEENYGIEGKLYDMLKEALFTRGAYVDVIIPEAALDDVVNQFGNTSFESATSYYSNKNNRNFMFLSTEEDRVKINNKDYSTEEILGITVTENPSVLKIPKLKDAFRSRQVNNRFRNYFKSSLSMEEESLIDDVFRSVNTYKDQKISVVNTPDFTSRKNITKPLVMNVPVESVIPVCLKSDPSKHLGYFLVLDDTGMPVTKEYMKTDTQYGNSGDAMSYNNSTVGISDVKLSLITRAKEELYGMTKDDPALANPDIAYNKVLERYLNSKIQGGEIGDIASISESLNLYKVMLSRALANQKTQLLYLPSELVFYMAYDYRNNGTGKSLLEKCGILYSVRAVLFFTKVMANIRNSITNTDVNVTLGENITNPSSVMETIQSEVLKTRETMFPIGIGRVDDIVNFLHRTGYKFNFKHPSLPEVDIEQNDSTRSMTVPDMEFDNAVNEMILMSFGLTPEIVQSGIETDFATTVAAKNMLFAKRINSLQDATNLMIKEYIVKLCSYDPILRGKLEELIDSNFKEIKSYINKMKKDKMVKEEFGKLSEAKIKEHILDVFITEMDIFLPKVEVTQANGLKDAFNDYAEVLQASLDIMFDSSQLTEELVGPLSGKIDGIKAIIKSVALNKWLADNNYLPELAQFLTKDEEGKPVFNILAEFQTRYENLFDAFLPFIKDAKKLQEKQQKALEKAEEGSSSSSSSDSSSDEDSGSENEEGGSEGGDEEGSDFGASEDAESGEGGEGEGGEGGGDDFGGGDDDDGGFGGFGEGDDFGGEGGGSKSKGKEETESDKKLKEAKAEKEYYYAQAAKLKAEQLAKQTGGKVEEYDKAGSKDEKKDDMGMGGNEDPFGEGAEATGGAEGGEAPEGNEGGEGKEEGSDFGAAEDKKSSKAKKAEQGEDEGSSF